MERTVTRLFDSYSEATRAAEEIERMGIDHGRVSLLANNSEGHFKGADHTGDRDGDGDNDAGEGAAKGATTGGLLGGGAGLAAGLGMLAIPGLGPVVAAGWLASTAVGAAVGALAGGATGGLVGALTDSGHTDEEAQVYAEGVRRGGALVSVKARDEAEAAQIEEAFQRLEGVDATSRGGAYRETGWSRYDDSAPQYSTEEMQRERTTYRDQRSNTSGQTTFS